MKKWLLLVGVVIIVISIVAFNSKFYYPSLPVNSVSKREVLESLNDSSKEIVKIAEENGYDWFITRNEQGKAYENLKRMVSEKGWQFKNQEGSGFFFEKDDKKLIATTEMWTGNYVIVQIRKN
ncbi:hypothetical protein ABET41_09690 [Metabacillus fastidiosus]|uniref:Uncharacterized protein n=1 Tax=Metabacillus fastidiosus TaxID=1458 RepID=A0ABU6NZQ9_9BACI|nr:hypothetical protein [Metabacillus fastidiosus]MED4402585.1 hypothetical protein [Metabacillus fastidiosus]MED4461945.1 hypothetical protein [Metabacillus fastidiosus]